MFDIAELRRHLTGRLIGRDDAEYGAACKVYNGMINRRPLAIARCEGPADIVAAVRAAAAENLPISIRGGGHNAAGLGVCDDGLTIDLSAMRSVGVDAEAKIAVVEGGCTWGDVDRATNPFGLAVPSGIVSTTGVGGLTLGGGTGHLTRRFGLTIDNLLAAEVVLADGRMVRASEDDHPDLFWALRGGGGNFGVVTAFEFQLQPVDTIVGGPTFWPLDRTAEVLRWYRDFILEAPEELSGFFAVMTVPPAPPFPAELQGQKVCAIVWCWTGAASRADEELAPVRKMNPALYGVQAMPFPALQSAFDPFFPPGLQWYWKADFAVEIPDAAIDEHVRFAAQLPTPHSTMHIYPMDGATHRIPEAATAFGHRQANFNQVIVGVDPDPAKRALITDWTRQYYAAIRPYGDGGGYVNFLQGDEGEERLRATYGANYDRLVEVKRRYDPANHFRVNHNINPRPLPQPSPHP